MSNLTRDELRAKIFASKEVKSKIIDFFGAQIELKQPKLKDIMSAKELNDGQAAVISTLVQYAYIPGTDENLFDDADADAFMEMPFGGDFTRVANALAELTEIDFLPPKVGSDETSSDS